MLIRPRINALLTKAIENPVTFIKAGEGCGKSTAVRNFLMQRKETAIWISLTSQDNDPEFFWENVCKTIYTVNREAALILRDIGFPVSKSQIMGCFSAFDGSAITGEKYIIVAEDLHNVHDPRVLMTVRQLINNLPARHKCILTSRQESRLNLINLLSKGLLSMLSTEELHFTHEEIRDFFVLKHITITEEEAALMLKDTEGWVLAISLISEDMYKNKKKYNSAIMGKGIKNILEDDFFTHLPDYLKYMLTIASLFESWPMEALEKIALSFNVKLPEDEELEKDLGSLSPLVRYDPYIQGLKIQNVYLELLRSKQNILSHEEIKDACTIKANWCLDNRLWTDAAVNFGRAHDYEGLIKSIYSFPRLMSYGTASLFLDIIEELRKNKYTLKDNDSFLFLNYAVRAALLLNIGRYEDSKNVLEECISFSNTQLLRDDKKESANLLLYFTYSSLATLSILSHLYNKDILKAAEFFKKGNEYLEQIKNLRPDPKAKINIPSYINLIGKDPKTGEYEKFIDKLSECIPYTTQQNYISGSLLGMDNLCRGELAFFTGDLVLAEQQLREGIIKTRGTRQYEAEAKALFYLLRICLGNGDTEGCMEVWEQMETQLLLDDNPNRYALFDIMSGWLYAHLGETERIASWLKEEYEDSGLNLTLCNFEFMVKAKYLYGIKHYKKALLFLQSESIEKSLGLFHLGILELKLLEASSFLKLGMEDKALKTLKEAYVTGNTNYSFEMPFIELGEDMRDLCRITINKDKALIPVKWLENIRNKSSVYTKKLSRVIDHYREKEGKAHRPVLLNVETEILDKMSKGYTREQIAQELSLSINTVKNTIKTIYTKLGALNQADAVRIALKGNLI